MEGMITTGKLLLNIHVALYPGSPQVLNPCQDSGQSQGASLSTSYQS